MTAATALADGALRVLSTPYAVDGRVSWHAPAARGVAPMHTHVLREGDRALLIDTGLPAHRAGVLARLDEVLEGVAELSVIHTRIGEFETIGNTVAIAERFGVRTLHDTHHDGELWVDFRPGWGRERAGGALGRLADARVEVIAGAGTIALGRDGGREVEAWMATLRLLPTLWLYDPGSRTLFTSDVFSHVLRHDDRGPWVVTAADDEATVEDLRRHLAGARYWWLPGAHTEGIRRGLDATFARWDVETIAPTYGCVLHGREVVARHRAMLDDLLAEAQALPPRPVDAEPGWWG